MQPVAVLEQRTWNLSRFLEEVRVSYVTYPTIENLTQGTSSSYTVLPNLNETVVNEHLRSIRLWLLQLLTTRVSVISILPRSLCRKACWFNVSSPPYNHTTVQSSHSYRTNLPSQQSLRLPASSLLADFYSSLTFLSPMKLPLDPSQPPLSPNSLAQSSNSFKPCLLTLGRMLIRLASKSSNEIGRISSMDICSRASPSERSGPIAASLARAVISEPEKPEIGC